MQFKVTTRHFLLLNNLPRLLVAYTSIQNNSWHKQEVLKRGFLFPQYRIWPQSDAVSPVWESSINVLFYFKISYNILCVQTLWLVLPCINVLCWSMTHLHLWETIGKILKNKTTHKKITYCNTFQIFLQNIFSSFLFSLWLFVFYLIWLMF